jgi:hypothetical protein
MICKNPDGATLFTIPPQLILTAWQAFKAAQEAAVAAPPSDIIQVGMYLHVASCIYMYLHVSACIYMYLEASWQLAGSICCFELFWSW